MFKYEKVLDILRDFKRYSRKRRRQVMTNLFYDEDFVKWLFQPDDIPNLTGVVSDFYEEFTKPYTMQAMIDVLDYEGYSDFDRSIATFMTSVANIAIETNNDVLSEADESRRDGDLTRSQKNKVVETINSSNEIIVKLLKKAKKIVKREASVLARDARLPRYITMSALTSVPDPKYVDTFKIGFYLNSLFNTIYSDVEENGEFERGVKWGVFFDEVFGERNTPDVATFILLEGTHRVEKYRHSRDVQRCWDSLTAFALRELNDSPGAVRNQMMDLYLKRLDKMFTNGSFDIRFNLLSLDGETFPALAETIAKYSDKLRKLMKR